MIFIHCPRCFNREEKYFYQTPTKIICRRCIHLDGLLVDPSLNVKGSLFNADLPFELSAVQKQASEWILRYGFDHSLLVDAVCGAGKTEMMVPFVEAALQKGLKVGWMIARRQVVIQLKERLQTIFPEMKVIGVCQGYTTDLVGDLVLCTAHQLYRFPNYFDVLIIDEPDAFPYVNNPLLEGLAKASCHGHFIYLTATPTPDLLSTVDKTITVHRRPHFRDLVVPEVRYMPGWLMRFWLAFLIRKQPGPWLIFVPSIRLAQQLARFLNCDVITSKTENSERIIQRFSNQLSQTLVSTTILERGVTFDEVSVVVFMASSSTFTDAALIQMNGRVGRSFNREKGVCYFLCDRKSVIVDQTIAKILGHNQAVSYVSEN